MSSSVPSHYQLNLSNNQLSKLRLKSSLNSLQTSRSVRSLTSAQVPLKLHWWQQKPILKDAYCTTLQKGSQAVAIFCLIHSMIQFLFALFNVYCLILANPGSSHFRQLGISFIFVYTGNQIVRWFLIFSSFAMLLLSIGLAFASIVLLKALQKEREKKFKPFLITLAIYIVTRFIASVYEGLVNDPIYFYHRLNLFVWLFVLLADCYGFLVVLSNYQELCDLTRLEDFAKEKARSLSLSRSIQDTMNRRNSGSCYSVSGRNSQFAHTPSQSPQTTQSSSSPFPSQPSSSPVTNVQSTQSATIVDSTDRTQTRTESSLSSHTRASQNDFTTLSTTSSMEAARKQHLQQLYAQQQQYYTELRRQREERRQQMHSNDSYTDNEPTVQNHQYLSVSNLPPIQRQGTPLL